MSVRLFLVLAALHFCCATAYADTLGAGSRTRALVIESEVLGEPRRVHVRVPPDFDGEQAYPVVYVLDGEWNFEYVAAYLEYMADNELYPDMLVAGIENVSRNRDYVPRPDPHFPYTGGAGAFLQFVETEWIPRMESEFRTAGQRILVGHSFGGVFTLHALFQRPALFDAYIALGSSAWVADRVLFEEAEALFGSDARPDAFVYMAVGENDGGPTVPSSQQLAGLFEARAPASLEWTFAVTPRTDHFSNFVSGLHQAFLAYFPTWGFDDEVLARARAGGADGVDAWFAEQEAQLGWRFQPPWFDLGVAALTLARENAAAALAVTAGLRRHHPDNAFVAFYSGVAFEAAGRLPEAKSAIDRAIALAQEQDLDPNELQLSSFEALRARIEEKIAAG